MSTTNSVTTTCVSCYRTFGFSSKNSFKSGLRRRISSKEVFKSRTLSVTNTTPERAVAGGGGGGKRRPQRLWMPTAGVGQSGFSLLKLLRQED